MVIATVQILFVHDKITGLKTVPIIQNNKFSKAPHNKQEHQNSQV